MKWFNTFNSCPNEIGTLLNKHHKHDKKYVEVEPDNYIDGFKLLQCYDCNEIIVVDVIACLKC